MKILIALDPAAPNSDAFAALHALTRGALDLDVCGLFIENTDLLRYSSLPVAREVCLSSGAVRHFTVLQLEDQFRARAARIRSTFDVAVRAFHGTSTFSVRRGSVLDELRAAAADADLLLIARSRASGGHRSWLGVAIAELLANPPCSLFFVQEPWATGNAVLVTSVDDAHPAIDVTRLGAHLAHAEHLPLHEIDFDSDVSAADQEYGGDPLLDTDNLIRACQRLKARVLVLPDMPAVREHVDLVRLVERVPASVLLVQLDGATAQLSRTRNAASSNSHAVR